MVESWLSLRRLYLPGLKMSAPATFNLIVTTGASASKQSHSALYHGRHLRMISLYRLRLTDSRNRWPTGQAPMRFKMEGATLLRRVIAYSLVVLALIPLALLLVWILIKGQPQGYTRPTDYTTRELQEYAKEFQAVGSNVYNTLEDASGRTPLDITVTDLAITSQIRILPPEDLRRLPNWLSNPQVVFAKDTVVLMGDVQVGGASTIISLHITPTVTENGNINVRLADTRAGLVSLPDTVRQQARASLENKVVAQRQKLEESSANAKNEDDLRQQILALETMEAGLKLLAGEEATIDMRRVGLIIEKIDLQDKRLRLMGKSSKQAGN